MRQTVTIPPAEIDRQLALCDQIHTLLEDRPGQKLAFVDMSMPTPRVCGAIWPVWATPFPTRKRGPTWSC